MDKTQPAFDPSPKPRSISCAHFSPGVTVSAMQAYVHKYQVNKDECRQCDNKCVEIISPVGA